MFLHQINQFNTDNDFGQGPVVSLFVNFCSFHCPGCWNSDTWERKDDLYMENSQVVQKIQNALDSSR